MYEYLGQIFISKNGYAILQPLPSAGWILADALLRSALHWFQLDADMMMRVAHILTAAAQ